MTASTIEGVARPAGLEPAATPRQDVCFMAAALARAAAALGTTAPNPAVGAVVVRGGEILGRGVTQPGGRPHAEVVALAQAGAAARGATLYVTLEPCARRSDPGFGGSCTDAILAAGIARMVVAADDPGPLAHGRCYERLAEAGVSVTRYVCADAARAINRGHVARVARGRPMVTLKLAETSDGFAAAGQGVQRLMISGAAAGLCVQELRSRHDAVMVGIGTVRADDPMLTVRLDRLPARRPARLVLDSDFSMSRRSRLVRSIAAAPVWVIGAADAANDREAALQAVGVITLRVRRGSDGRLDLRACLACLADHGITRVFSEGGPTLAAALVAADLVDEVAIFTGPQRLDGPGLPALSPAARTRLADAAAFRLSARSWVGADRLIRYERID